MSYNGRGSVPAAGQHNLAAAEVQYVLLFLLRKDFRIQRVDDLFTALLAVQKARTAQYLEMVRHIGQFGPQRFRQRANAVRAGLQTLDDLQPFGIGEASEFLRAALCLDAV